MNFCQDNDWFLTFMNVNTYIDISLFQIVKSECIQKKIYFSTRKCRISYIIAHSFHTINKGYSRKSY